MNKIIAEIVERLKKEYKPQKIILFGSYAMGNPTEDSDIDILIIKNTDEGPMARWLRVRRMLRDFNRKVSISPLVYTEEELQARQRIKDFFIAEILEKGEILYG